MQQNFANCPLCSRIFDFIDEKSTRVQIDGVVRYACSTCTTKFRLGDVPVATTPPDGKPNGGLIHRAQP